MYLLCTTLLEFTPVLFWQGELAYYSDSLAGRMNEALLLHPNNNEKFIQNWRMNCGAFFDDETFIEVRSYSGIICCYFIYVRNRLYQKGVCVV